MKSRSSVRLGPVASQILGYLSTHKDAQDTVEGIAEWWLMEQRVRRMISEVKQALGELVTAGMVLRRKGRDGRVHYRLNSRMHKSVANQLRQAGSAAPPGAGEASVRRTDVDETGRQ